VRARALPPPAERTPARPGPGPVPDAVLRSLDLAVLRRVQSLVPGEHLTPQVGSGTELALIRPYRPGDDVRFIDWNVTARMREPHVRVHVGERAMTAWMVLDVSASMSFGTALRRKADVAEGVALAIGHVATRRGNRLGVLAFGDREPRVLRPRQGRLGLLGLLSELRRGTAPGVGEEDERGPRRSAIDRQGRRAVGDEHPRRRSAIDRHGGRAVGDEHPRRRSAIDRHGGRAVGDEHPPRQWAVDRRGVGDEAAAPEDGPPATLGAAARHIAALARARGLIVIVSDFRGPRDWEGELRTLRARHGVLAVEVRDPRELELPPVGDLFMTDPETGRQIVVNTSRKKVRERFKAAAAAEREAVAAALRSGGIDHLVLGTDRDWLRDLAGHLRRAEHMRRAALAAGGPGRAATAAHAVPGGPR
jgi:uncharacterized protein (DUF58 family)